MVTHKSGLKRLIFRMLAYIMILQVSRMVEKLGSNKKTSLLTNKIQTGTYGGFSFHIENNNCS